jgi:DNA primase
LQFLVESVMDGADLSSAAAKDRVLARLRPVLAGVAPSAERDEQVRQVADRLALSEHLLAPLLAKPAPTGRTAGGVAERRPTRAAVSTGAAARGERWERIFLAMCVSSGERGREYLARLSDEHLSSEVLRRARAWILEHFDSPTVGLSDADPQLAQVVSEIVVRASSEPASKPALEIGFLGLERRRLEAATKLAAAAEDYQRQHELTLERSRVTETIAKLMGEEPTVGSEGA